MSEYISKNYKTNDKNSLDPSFISVSVEFPNENPVLTG